MTNNKKVNKKDTSSNKPLTFMLLATWTLFAAAGGYLYTNYQPKIERISSMEERVAELEKQLRFISDQSNMASLIEKQDSTGSSQSVEKPEPQKLQNDNMEGLHSTFEYLSYDHDPKKQTLSEINNRTAALEKQISNLNAVIKSNNEDIKYGRFVISAIQLRDAIRSTKSFDRELDALKLFKTDQKEFQDNIMVLERYSRAGVPDMAKLKNDFDKIADKIVNTARQEKENPDAVDKIAMKFSSVVSIRKTGDIQGTGGEEIIARAQNYLEHNNIESATKELQSLNGNAANVAKEWLDEANAMLITSQASDKIFNYVVNIVNQSKNDSLQSVAIE